jgi:hypothetical protein
MFANKNERKPGTKEQKIEQLGFVSPSKKPTAINTIEDMFSNVAKSIKKPKRVINDTQSSPEKDKSG